jgi:hypothetical protein
MLARSILVYTAASMVVTEFWMREDIDLIDVNSFIKMISNKPIMNLAFSMKNA